MASESYPHGRQARLEWTLLRGGKGAGGGPLGSSMCREGRPNGDVYSWRACDTLNCIRVGCTLGASGMETDWITGDDKVVPVYCAGDGCGRGWVAGIETDWIAGGSRSWSVQASVGG